MARLAHEELREGKGVAVVAAAWSQMHKCHAKDLCLGYHAGKAEQGLGLQKSELISLKEGPRSRSLR